MAILVFAHMSPDAVNSRQASISWHLASTGNRTHRLAELLKRAQLSGALLQETRHEPFEQGGPAVVPCKRQSARVVWSGHGCPAKSPRSPGAGFGPRSEERRVGKECRSR